MLADRHNLKAIPKFYLYKAHWDPNDYLVNRGWYRGLEYKMDGIDGRGKWYPEERLELIK